MILFKLSLAVTIIGITLLGASRIERDTYLSVEIAKFGYWVLCIGLALNVITFPTVSSEAKRISSGECIAQETEMYQPEGVSALSGQPFEPSLHTRFVCPQTEFWRKP